MLLFVLVLALAAVPVWSAVARDEVKQLPGLHKQPSFRHFSGYLQALGTRRLHYWFVESARNPAKDPVVLWLNGGPGCSSLLGLITENGPFRLKEDAATVVYNPESWNNIANMIFLEAPAGVGFSYSENQNYSSSDDQTAENNYAALKDFFQKYPEYRSNDFYITGESYGGIYVPTLSVLVLKDSSFNFKGFAVGNAITNYQMNDDSLIYFGYYHGLYGDDLYNKLMKFCCGDNVTQCHFFSNKSPECTDALSHANTMISDTGLNVYNLYAECISDSGPANMFPDNTIISMDIPWLLSRVESQQKMRMNLQVLKTKKKVRSVPPCINGTASLLYFNTPAVRKALNIPDHVQQWDVCSSVLEYNYTYSTMKNQYMKVLNANKRILVYNGDVDMACNFLGDEWFVESLNLNVDEDRKPWYYTAKDGTKQVAGFVKQFSKLALVTVRGSGHMVPTDQPIPAFHLFRNFIEDKPY